MRSHPWRRARRLALALLLAASAARSHEATSEGLAGGWTWSWTWDPLVLALLVCTGGLYARGLARLWRRTRGRTGGRRAGRSPKIRSGQAACFALGLVVLVMALLSPLDASSDLLFSAHMTQHELLMLVAAPLLVLGRPLAPVVGGLPAALRRVLVRRLHAPAVIGAARRATGPIFVWLLNAGVLWAWHVPLLYEAALESEAIHWLQHASFLGAAGLFWWALIDGRYGRAGHGIAALFVFATALQSSLLAALLTLSPEPWYPIHRLRLAAGGMSAAHDQQLAGLIMWVPAGVLLALIALALFTSWLGEVERRRLQHDAVSQHRTTARGSSS